MAIDLEAAKALVLESIHEYSAEPGKFVLLEDMTLEKPYGWVFFYDSARHQQTGHFLDMLGGNGPVVVESATGRVTQLGSAKAPEKMIAAFEDKHHLDGGTG